MKVREVMTTDVVTVHPDTPLKEVARLLIEHRISGVPVVEKDGSVVGILSEGDFLAMSEPRPANVEPRMAWLLAPFREAEDHRARIHTTTAGEVMARRPITTAPDSELRDAAHLMTTSKVKRLPVVEDGKLVGIVTRADVVRAFARSDEELFEVIRRALRAVEGLQVLSVRDGVATLAGDVPHPAVATAVHRLVREIEGVIDVDDNAVVVAEAAYT